MDSIAKVGSALQELFGPAVEAAAARSGVIKRQRKFTAMSLAKTFVLGFLANPDATDEDLARMAVQVGAAVTPQAVEQRFAPALEQFLKDLLGRATQIVVSANQALAPILERFRRVILQDSSTLVLPDDQKEEYPGCGGSYGGGQAALKLQVEWDLRGGALTHLQIEAGRSPDGATTRQQARRGPGKQVGGRWGHQDQVRGLAELHVRHVVDARPHVGGHRLAGQRRPGGFADEAQRVGGGHDPHVVTRLFEQAQQLTCLVRGDSGADTEDDARHGGPGG